MSERQNRGPVAWLGQGLLYGLFACIIGVFSTWPPYHYLADDQALIKLSFNHQGQVVADCRTVSAEELSKLKPTMRKTTICPRERSPITVELDIDGKQVLHQVAQPSGLSRDGASTTYHRLVVPAGSHTLVVRLKDDVRSVGFDHARTAVVTLRPAQILVIDYEPGEGGITLR
ncbi:MAG: hypothetical protein ABIR55_01465 [Burkholderiaceae bacterium]